MKKGSIVVDILKINSVILLSVKYRHLVTRSYAEHKVLDDLYNGIAELSDKLVECMLGVVELGNISNDEVGIGNVVIYGTKGEMIDSLVEYVDVIDKMVRVSVKKYNGICAILDEIVILVNKSIYLLGLN